MQLSWILVDDDPHFLKHIKDSFCIFSKNTLNPPKILAATNVTDALLLVQNELPSLIVTDIQMPQVDGFQFLRFINRKYPDIPKVVVSGQLSEKTEALCLQVGVALTISKPHDAQEILSLFRKLQQLTKQQAGNQLLPAALTHPSPSASPLTTGKEALMRVTGKIIRRADSLVVNSILQKVKSSIKPVLQGINPMIASTARDNEMVSKAARVTGLIKKIPREANTSDQMSASSGKSDSINNPKKDTNNNSRGFSGVLPQINLAELVQMLSLSSKSSVLEISSESIAGCIYIQDGIIIHAQTTDQIGESAVYTLLNLEGGQFELLDYTPPSQCSVKLGTQHLLIEAARLMDECDRKRMGNQPEAYPATIQTTRVTSTISVLEERSVVLYESNFTAKETTQNQADQIGETDCSSALLNVDQDLEELLICNHEGKVTYHHGPSDPAQRVDLLEFFSSKSKQVTERSLGYLYYIHFQGAEMESLITLGNDSSLFARTKSRSLPINKILHYAKNSLCLTPTS